MARAKPARQTKGSPGNSGRLTVTMTGPQTIARVEESYAALTKALGESADVAVDCAPVEEADVAFLQLLLAARRDATAAGRRLVLAAPAGGALAGALTAAGFERPGQPGAWTDSFWAGED